MKIAPERLFLDAESQVYRVAGRKLKDSNIEYIRADLTDALVEAAEEVIKSATGAYNEKRTNVSKDKFKKLKDALAALKAMEGR